MAPQCEFEIGQLVEYRAWYDGEGSWICIENQIGVVLEVIAIKNSDVKYFDPNIVVYDIKVYWIIESKTEIVPDLLLVEYGKETMKIL